MNRTRLILSTVGVLTTVALSSGCAAGMSAATLQVKPNFAAGATHGILAQNIVVVVDPETHAAQLTGTIVNTTDASDQLVSVRIGSSAVTAPLPVSIDPKGALNLAAVHGAGFVAPRSDAKPGVNSTVSLKFATGGELNVTAGVEENTGVYSGFQPSIAK